MTAESTVERKRKAKAWILISVLATIAAIIISLVVIIVMFLAASESARSATSNVEFSQTLFGLPIFTGFRHDGHFGTHAYPGLLVFPAFVFAVGILTSVPVLRNFVAAGH